MSKSLIEELKSANAMLMRYENKVMDDKPTGEELSYFLNRIDYWSKVAQSLRLKLFDVTPVDDKQ
ncbi:MAG: hypothetical protein EB078_13280 [Proteobacteria bacterium]|nr:hypothetical protein [Pseudomonadota bacterium]NDD05871.1 hypothetical protein [Pseudomonadota bacterium]NDG28387.1 hypothetical protein [Pseudomonadota bacterium]